MDAATVLWGVALALFTIFAPVLQLWMTFRSRSPLGGKFEFAFILLFAWFVAFCVLLIRPELPFSSWGVKVGVIASLGFWVGLHRMVSQLTWRHRWLLHLPIAGLAFATIVVAIWVLGYTPGGHY